MNQTLQTGDLERFSRALSQLDEANSADPNLESDAGRQWPRELLYAHRLTQWVLRLNPTASEPLRLAARAAHLRRWEISRTSYPPTRAGYLRWRADLKSFHASKVGEILLRAGYPEELTSNVKGLVSKASFPHDPDSRVLEDALCLVFLQFQLKDLLVKSGEEKVIGALQKTWRKMTPAGHAAALELNYEPGLRQLIQRALSAALQPGNETSPASDDRAH